MEKNHKKLIEKVIFKNNMGNYVIAAFLSCITALFEIALAFGLMYLIDMSQNQDLTAIRKILLVIGLAAVVYVVIGITSTCFLSRYTKKAVCNLRGELLSAIICKPLSSVSKKSTGSYISLLNNDMNTVELNYIVGSVTIVRFTVMMIGALIAMLYTQWMLTIIVIIASMLPLLVSLLFGGRMEKNQEMITDSNQSLNSSIKDILSGIPVVKSFHIEKEILKIVNGKSYETEEQKKKYTNLAGIQGTLMTLTALIILIVIFACGTVFAVKGLMTIGGVIAFVQLLNNLTAPITNLSVLLVKKRACLVIFDIFADILSKPDNESKGKEIKDSDCEIHINNLSYSVDDNKEIIHGISFRFEAGKSYAIVGLSGCGKSTLLSLLAGYYDNYQGSIKIGECELKEIAEENLYKTISFVQQESFIFNDTIDNNIKLFRQWTKERVQEVIQTACLDKLIGERGKDMMCGENGSQLSGGEKQRISIARALLGEPAILILDEATSALDMTTTLSLEKSLSELKNVTRIAVTHKVSEDILSGYDSIVMIKDGRIVENGSYQELMDKKGQFYAFQKVSS